MLGREEVGWLAHGRELREMWCCPLPKGLGTSQGPHGLVYTGQPHRDWLGIKQWTNKVTMEPSPKQKSCDIKESKQIRGSKELQGHGFDKWFCAKHIAQILL